MKPVVGVSSLTPAELAQVPTQAAEQIGKVIGAIVGGAIGLAATGGRHREPAGGARKFLCAGSRSSAGHWHGWRYNLPTTLRSAAARLTATRAIESQTSERSNWTCATRNFASTGRWRLLS